MNAKRILSLTGAFLFCFATLFAGSNEKGIEYYRAKLYNAAKIFFLQQKNQSVTEQVENYYYLGQTYYELNQADSAQYYYQKAVATDSEYPFGYIGEGKLELKKGNDKGAEDLFKRANNYAKKDPSVQTTIAEVYVDAGKFDKAEEALGKARKVNKNYSGIYVAEGDMLMKEGKVGDASGRYENAILFDKSDKVAYLKLAEVYESINPDLALDYLNQLIAIDPSYIPAYAIIGDINREQGMYKDALDAYEKFISIPGVPLLQHERYAQLLYFTDQYDKSLQQINYVLSQDPNNSVMHRLLAYNNYKLDNTELGLQQMNDFLKNAPADKHIYLDYMTLGRLYLKEKQPEQAIAAFVKASELDGTKSEVFKELTTAYEQAGNYPEAIKYYEKYFEVEPNASNLDYFYYGQANYLASTKYLEPANPSITPEQKAQDDADLKSYISKGDAAFAEVISRSPDSYLGYLWRGNLNSILDAKEYESTEKMSGAAKPYYEQALGIMLEKNENGARNRDIISVYDYLSNYYFIGGDNSLVGEYNKKILEIDPENGKAKQTLDALKIKY